MRRDTDRLKLTASDLPVPRIAERCRDDLERRWCAGERIAVDGYFEQYPALFEDSESSLLLIYSEFLLRERFGEHSSPAQFYRRFPRFADELQAQFQLHSALGSQLDDAPEAANGFSADTDMELFEEIGRGGMGVVLRGHDRVLDRELAVKVLRPGQHEDRFYSEARIGGRLQHPGIVPVHQLGRLADGRPFFTMKLVEGSTLAKLLAERPDPQLRLSEFLRIFEKVCQTIAYAHERGVIHRDLKPANVMVGRFGEVQVMDWGLSKFVGTSDSPRKAKPNNSGHDTVTSGFASTQNGAVIGTPGYMAPEQAGSGTEADARTDVFGLGAILCEILTGEPPYLGADRAVLLAQSARGELATARERIDRSGADADLINLAKTCLAAEPTNRPSNAGEVAKSIADHFAGTEARLRTVELERAAAEARSIADRRARRLTAGLAAAGVAFAVLMAGGAIWYSQDRDRRNAETQQQVALLEQDVRVEMQKAADLNLRARELVNDPPRWEATMAGALSAVRRASSLAGTEGLPINPSLHSEVAAIMSTIEDDEGDRQLITTLEAMRVVRDGHYDFSTASDRIRFNPKYRAAFAARGLEATETTIEVATAWLTRRPPLVRAALMAMLDDWLLGYTYGDSDPTAVWLRDVLQAAETDPWMHKIRDVRRRPTLALEELRRLADEADFTAHPPAAYYLLALDLSWAGDMPKALVVLRRAQLCHAGDFRLNFFLGSMLAASRLHHEAIRYYQAARVARPHDALLLSNLGIAFRNSRDYDSSEVVFRQALAIDSKIDSIHANLATTLAYQRNLPKALEHARRAIELNPMCDIGHRALAAILCAQNDTLGAIASAERALQIDPKYGAAYETLGDAQAKRKDWAAAVAARRKAAELEPNTWYYHRNLGLALKELKDWTGAAAAFRRAIELERSDVETFRQLGHCCYFTRDWNAAVEAYRSAIALAPKHAHTHASLADCLRRLKDLPGALGELHLACELNDRESWTHQLLGYTYRDLNDPSRALAEFNRSIELDAKSFGRHFEVGTAMHFMGQYESAERVFRRCLELSPDDPRAHCSLALVLRDRCQFADAVESLRRGHALGTKQKDWKTPSAVWLKQVEELHELNEKLPNATAVSATQQLNLAKFVAQYHRNYAEATRLAHESFNKDPSAAKSGSIDASRWAARAAGASKTEQERITLGRQSREWLRTGIESSTPTAEEVAVWKDLLRSPEFALYRDDALLYKLPQAERSAWRVLWDDLRMQLVQLEDKSPR